MPLPKLAKLQPAIMQVLWTEGPCSVRKIQEAFPEKERTANEPVVSMNGLRKLYLASAAVLTILIPVAAGALRIYQGLPTALGGPVFEVISVKPTPPDQRFRTADSTLQNGRYYSTNQTLMSLIEVAYATRATFPAPIPLDRERITGGPDWIDKQRFTVEASAGRPSTGPELAQMLRNLLADRFKLKVHTETRQLPVYGLVRVSQEKLGPALRKSENCDSGGRMGIGGGAGRLNLVCAPMPLFAELLTEFTHRPVIDFTGLSERYDGEIEFAPLETESDTFGGARPPATATVPLGPSIFTALPEQFGLRLVSQRSPVEFLVIDGAQLPEEN